MTELDLTRQGVDKMFREFLELRAALATHLELLNYFCCPVCKGSWFKTPNTAVTEIIQCSRCKWKGSREEGEAVRFFKEV